MPKILSPDSQFTSFERRNLLRTGRLLHSQPELDIRYLKREADSSRLPGRILVITPRKIGNAPQRNLIRRRLKAIFREESLGLKGYDIAIYCKKSSTQLSFQDLKTLLITALSQIPSSGPLN